MIALLALAGGISCGTNADDPAAEEVEIEVDAKSDGMRSIVGRWHGGHEPGQPTKLILKASGRKKGEFFAETRQPCPSGRVCLPASGSGSFKLSHRWFSSKYYVTFSWGDGQELKYEWKFIDGCDLLCRFVKIAADVPKVPNTLILTRPDDADDWGARMTTDDELTWCSRDAECENGRLGEKGDICLRSPGWTGAVPKDRCVRNWCRPGCDVPPADSWYEWFY